MAMSVLFIIFGRDSWKFYFFALLWQSSNCQISPTIKKLGHEIWKSEPNQLHS